MGALVVLSLSKRRRINMLLSETLLIALGTSVAKYLAGALLPREWQNLTEGPAYEEWKA